MYWHIDTDIVALIAICALYAYTVKSLPQSARSAQNRGFLFCLRAGIVMTVIDIAASVIMEVPTTRFLYHLLLSAYLLTIDLCIVCWFLYSLTILYADDEKGRRRAHCLAVIPYALYALLVCTNPWTGLMFTLGPDMAYARGPLFLYSMIGLFAGYTLVLFLLLFLRRRHIPAEYPRIVLLMQPLIMAVSIPVQLLNAGWLMILPAYSLCLLLALLFFQDRQNRTERAQLKQLTELVEHFACGLSICLITKEKKYEIQYLSNGLAAMYETDSETLAGDFGADMLSHVCAEDRETVRAHLEDMTANAQDNEMIYRILTGAGNLKWVRVTSKVTPFADGSAIVYATYTDMTEQKKLQQQLSDVIQNVPSGICIYRWDGEDLHPMIVNARFSEMLGEDALEYLRTVDHFGYSHVHPEDLPALQRESLAALTETHRIDVTYRSLNSVTGEYLWVRMRGKMLPQEDGTQLVLVSYNDVTAEHETERQLRESEKELWAKYELEKKRATMDDDNLLIHALFNLTTGETLEYLYKDGTEVLPENRDAFSYSQANAYLLIDEEERAQFLALNTIDNLLARFASGETEFKLDYRRLRKNGDITWVRSTLHMVRDPRTNDVLLFEYWYDIEEEKMLQLMYRSIASDNYDYVARINGKTGRFHMVPKPGLTYHMPPTGGEDADAVTTSVYNDCVFAEDRETVIENTLIKNIKAHLRENGRFQFTYREVEPDGSIRHKRITQYYIDPLREIIVMLREDITELIRVEMEKNLLLAEALADANQASEAKSQFLSRVSHELRTPLNAIIGFMELAKGASSAQVSAYLANSDMAAKQLLSIINDVLDMSSIESGKLKIARAPFDFKALLQSITNIYVAQCHEKGIGYDTRLLTPIDEWLIGDQLRVNQILLNLLNNAVKFTDEGRISLRISQTELQNSKVSVRFEVTDTGCGMDDKMLERLFRPFEQESATTARKYGGNGLGLSIVNNLVRMMDGVIRVESRQGEGSCFIVDLPFTRSEAELSNRSLEGVGDLHVLCVDDEELERAYVSTMLTRIGVRHACVSGGDEALSELRRADGRDDAYNICLIDWKMPDMNGMETARRIRTQYGKDVIVIVMSAYDHYQADESARAAGANMFISKPLFQSSLFDLFSTLTGGRIAKREPVPLQYEFAGKRVLLAEDNLMNRMVAEGLIKKFGMECETAADGRVAADMFLASPAGYYDAVLMDIQMPQMDGFEATRAIRASGHPNAGSVQIIALTANAFSEDIAKSLSSGMNAHVSKPIEPDILAAALARAFAAGKE